MNKTVSAYEARTKLGELMNLVYYKGIEVIVEKMGKPMVRITRIDKTDDAKIKTKKTLMEFAGIWANKDGELIEKYAKNLRRTATVLRT